MLAALERPIFVCRVQLPESRKVSRPARRNIDPAIPAGSEVAPTKAKHLLKGAHKLLRKPSFGPTSANVGRSCSLSGGGQDVANFGPNWQTSAKRGR